MQPIVLISTVLINFVVGEQSLSKYAEEKSGLDVVMGNPIWKQHLWRPRKLPRNATYIEKAENMIRFPTIEKSDDANKRKSLKKSPKRTIQKIIKKNRQKTKKIFVVKMTTDFSPEMYDAQEDLAQGREEKTVFTTVPSSLKKKSKKWNSRTAGYKMPFHKLHKMKSNKREKRDIAREDLYILKDFNEIKFIKENKDFSVVNAHVKKYW